MSAARGGVQPAIQTKPDRSPAISLLSALLIGFSFSGRSRPDDGVRPRVGAGDGVRWSPSGEFSGENHGGERETGIASAIVPYGKLRFLPVDDLIPKQQLGLVALTYCEWQ
nr:hypothetical protein Iba_scaffold13602CG0010 [Ipomoea batatas]